MPPTMPSNDPVNCPHCGKNILAAPTNVRVWNNAMFPYVLASNGKMFGVMNNDADEVILPANDDRPELKLVREDVYNQRLQLNKFTALQQLPSGSAESNSQVQQVADGRVNSNVSGSAQNQQLTNDPRTVGLVQNVPTGVTSSVPRVPVAPRVENAVPMAQQPTSPTPVVLAPSLNEPPLNVQQPARLGGNLPPPSPPSVPEPLSGPL